MEPCGPLGPTPLTPGPWSLLWQSVQSICWTPDQVEIRVRLWEDLAGATTG